MTASVAKLLFPISLVVAAALWAKSYTDVGDGFSAGAIAGLGAVLQYICLDHDEARKVTRADWAKRLVAAGLVLVVVLLLAPALFGGPPVTHLPRPGVPAFSLGALELHTAVLVDLGVALVVYGVLVGTFDRMFPPLGREQP